MPNAVQWWQNMGTLKTRSLHFCHLNSLLSKIDELSTPSLLDHILTNSSEKKKSKRGDWCRNFRSSIIYCTRKIKRIKHNIHNQIQVQSLKNYSAEIFTNALKTVQFPNYNIFSNVNVVYSDLVNKISDTIDNVPPIKAIRIKNNTQDWFDNEIAKAIKTGEKYF